MAIIYHVTSAEEWNVAKEKGYTYVYDKSVLIIGPQGDDLLPYVAQKLNIKLPPNVPIGLR